MVRKTISAVLPAKIREGLADDDRMLWTHMKIEGYVIVAFCNVYFETGLKITEANLDALWCISDATDGGRKIVIASGDFNIPAIEFQNSGLLYVLGWRLSFPPTSTIRALAARAEDR